jgi:hypothetical protein
MNFDQTAPWVPPNTSYLRFHNCDIVADWAYGFFTSLDIPAAATIRLVDNGLSDYWNGKNISSPNNEEVISWALDFGQPIFISTLNYTYQQCRNEFCRKLPWEGNADLAGRGVSCEEWI